MDTDLLMCGIVFYGVGNLLIMALGGELVMVNRLIFIMINGFRY